MRTPKRLNTMTVSKMAKVYGIPRTTLYRRIRFAQATFGNVLERSGERTKVVNLVRLAEVMPGFFDGSETLRDELDDIRRTLFAHDQKLKGHAARIRKLEAA